MKKFVVVLLLFVLVLSVFAVNDQLAARDTAVSHLPTTAAKPVGPPMVQTVTDIPRVTLSEQQRYIVQLDGPPAATAGQTDASVASSQSLLATQQTHFLTTSSIALKRPLQPIYQYDLVFNGVTLALTGEEAGVIAEMAGVTAVHADVAHELLTDMGPRWIGADHMWDGTAVPGNIGNMGEGVLVGIIDTGINMDHPSFAAVGGDGYVHQNPLGDGNFKGVCDTTSKQYDSQYVCNSKLVGAWNFADGPEDNDGHGSHVASTAAGNVVSATIETATGFAYEATISGVAPHANIIAYDACLTACYQSDLLAAVNQAVADGVDVINYSISGGESPYTDVVAQAFLVANEAGIFISAAAGNDGPGVQTINHQAPWVMTVGAMTHARVFINQLIDFSGGNSVLADITGKSATAGYGPAQIVYAADYGDALCLNPFAPNTFAGEIVVCDRGIIARTAKGNNVLAGGAGGLVLVNAREDGVSLNADEHVLPAVQIAYADGVLLKTWLSSGSGHMATIAGTTAVFDPTLADVMAKFSSRGPNSAMDVIKPDITGPGVDVLAAVQSTAPLDPPEFGLLSGTSMATPHLTGAVALLRKAHPSWTPDEVRSALMMTTVADNLYNENGQTQATPFDRGAGRVDLSRAALTGLVMHETVANYEAAETGDPTTLNIPSLAESSCFGQCSWTRTFKSVLNGSTTWTATAVTADGLQISLTPSEFTIASGASQTVQIVADVSNVQGGTGWVFAMVELSSPGQETLRLPVAVQKSLASSPGELEITGPQNAEPEQIISYEIKLDNLDNMTHTFQLTNTLPPGVAYVQNSATGGLIYDEVNHRLTWAGEMGPGTMGYEVTAVNPPLPYVNLGALPDGPDNLCDLFADCDDSSAHFDLSSESANYTLYGESLEEIFVSANGVLYGPQGHTTTTCLACPQPLPTAVELNQVMAGLWRDLDASLGVGQWYAALLEGWLPGSTVFYANWHDVGQFGAPFITSRHAIAVVLDGQSEPVGRIYYLYDGIPDSEGIMDNGYVIGVENRDGGVGQTIAFSPCDDLTCIQDAQVGAVPANGTTLRLDPGVVGGPSAKTFTYQVRVTAATGTLLSNRVDTTMSSGPGINSAVADTLVEYRIYMPIVFR